MKKLNYFVMLGLSATLVLASCSQQRYAHRAKVRVNDQAKEQVNEEKKELARVTPVPAEESTQELKQEEAAALVIKPENASPKPKEVFKQLTSKETRTFFKELAKDPKQIRDLVVKEDNKTKQAFEESTGMESSRWLTWVIIGLVLILIAFFLPSPLSGIFHLVGSILVVVGLIFLLLELL